MVRAFSACLVFLLACTGKTPGQGPDRDAAPTKPPPAVAPADSASASPVPEGSRAAGPLGDLELGPECRRFVDLVQRECADGSALHRCVQAGHRLTELAAMKPGTDGTHARHDQLCTSEIETFEIRRREAGGS